MYQIAGLAGVCVCTVQCMFYKKYIYKDCGQFAQLFLALQGQGCQIKRVKYNHRTVSSLPGRPSPSRTENQPEDTHIALFPSAKPEEERGLTM